MFIGKQRLLIKAPKKTVYEIAEKYPTFVRFFLDQSRIVSESDAKLLVVVETKLLGFLKTRWIGRGNKKKYESILFTQTVGLFKGLRAFWLFQDAPNGTEVLIRTSFSKPRLGGLGEWLLGKYIVEKTTKRLLFELNSASIKTYSKLIIQ